MARIFITGSADGLGAMAGQRLAGKGHDVVLHARSAKRAADVMRRVPVAQAVLVADVSTVSESVRLAEQANSMGRFDAVIHNVAVFHQNVQSLTTDGYAPTFAINTLAPYVLTALMLRPRRLIYLCSDMHAGGELGYEDLAWTRRKWHGAQAYSDSKLHDVMLAMAVSRRWPEVLSNAVDPGWVATRMGGAGAPGDLAVGSATQVWLAASDDVNACVSGRYFYRHQARQACATAHDSVLQDELLEQLASFTGIRLAS
jgi:NAD(P)-dependent dehydrogenase (short-subunit alcohol dehydrogenase family)